jgi:hypothetical protein
MGAPKNATTLYYILFWVVFACLVYLAFTVYVSRDREKCLEYCEARLLEGHYIEPKARRRSATKSECKCIEVTH